MFILLAYLVSLVVQKKEGMVVVVMSMVMAGGVNFIPDNNRAPDQVANFVREELHSDGKVLIVPPYYNLTFIYHFDQALFESDSMLTNRTSIGIIQAIYNFDEVEDSALFSQFILVDDHFDELYPGNNVKTKLNAWGKLEKEKTFEGDTKVMVFTKS